jgi:hypothetical protein
MSVFADYIKLADEQAAEIQRLRAILADDDLYQENVRLRELLLSFATSSWLNDHHKARIQAVLLSKPADQPAAVLCACGEPATYQGQCRDCFAEGPPWTADQQSSRRGFDFKCGCGADNWNRYECGVCGKDPHKPADQQAASMQDAPQPTEGTGKQSMQAACTKNDAGLVQRDLEDIAGKYKQALDRLADKS